MTRRFELLFSENRSRLHHDEENHQSDHKVDKQRNAARPHHFHLFGAFQRRFWRKQGGTKQKATCNRR